MLFLKAVIFIASIAGIIYIGYLFVVDLGFPRSLIEAIKPYQCQICKKKYWSSRKAFRCCEGTPEHAAWLRREFRRARSGPRSYRERERDCPLCHGEAGHYMCPMCEGRGKTFM